MSGYCFRALLLGEEMPWEGTNFEPLTILILFDSEQGAEVVDYKKSHSRSSEVKRARLESLGMSPCRV